MCVCWAAERGTDASTSTTFRADGEFQPSACLIFFFFFYFINVIIDRIIPSAGNAGKRVRVARRFVQNANLPPRKNKKQSLSI
jgi:hypothetical protein